MVLTINHTNPASSTIHGDGSSRSGASEPSAGSADSHVSPLGDVHPVCAAGSGLALDAVVEEPMIAPPRKNFLLHVSSIFARKRIVEPTFEDFTNLAADFSALFQQQVIHRDTKASQEPEIEPGLAKKFCADIVNNPRHRETIRYIVECVVQGKTINEVIGKFKEQNRGANAAGEPYPFPESVLPFVEIALKSVFRQLPTADHLKNTRAEIQESIDDAAHKFLASMWATVSHKAVSLGMKLMSGSFHILGVKNTLYIASWFVPDMIKRILDTVVPKKAEGIDPINPPKATLHDAAQYVLDAFSRLRPVKAALENAKEIGTVEIVRPFTQKALEGMKDIVNQLWKFSADLMSATDGTVDIKEGPYKGWQLLEDDTVITKNGDILKNPEGLGDHAKDYFSHSTDLRAEKNLERRKAMLDAFKNNISFFRRMFQSENPSALFNSILEESVLPDDLKTLIHDNTKIIFESNDLTALMKSLLQASNAVPLDESNEEKNARVDAEKPILEKVEAGMGQLIDLIPSDQLDKIANLFTKTLQNFNPNDIPYFETFKDELVGSLKSSERVKSLSDVAGVLTENYFQAIPIHKKRRMACAILSGGKPEFKNGDTKYLDDKSKTNFILAMTNKGGIAFQKAMQLFGDSVNDPVMRDALASMKDSVESLGEVWAENKYKTELADINEKLRTSAEIGSEYAQYTVADKSFNATPLKAATVGQVHSARVDITYHVRKENSVDVKGDGVIQSKTIKNKPVVIKLLRENAEREVNVEMKALMSLSVVKEKNSVKGTLEGVKEGILEEVNFNLEKENGDILSKIYTGTAYTSGFKQKIKMQTAEVYAANSEMLIEEFVQGSNFKELWNKGLDENGRQTYVKYKEDPASDADAVEIHPYSQRSVEEQLEFLEHWRLSVGLLARNWVSGLVNGTSDDGSANLSGMGVVDSDRHSGNWMYDPYKKTVYVIDYGTITKLDRQQRAAMVNLTAAIFARNADGVVNNLAELMRPAGKTAEESVTATEFLRRRNLPFSDEEPDRTLTTDIGKVILERAKEEKHSDLLRALQNVGFLTSETTLDNLYQMIPQEILEGFLNLKSGQDPDPAQAIITALSTHRTESLLTDVMKLDIRHFLVSGQKNTVELMEYINAHDQLGLPNDITQFSPYITEKKLTEVLAQTPDAACVELCRIFDNYKTRFHKLIEREAPVAEERPATEKTPKEKLQDYIKTDSGHRLFNIARPNGSEQSRWLPISLSDANGELYFIRTIQKIANVLTDYGISAPKSIVQLNRGTSFMRNHLSKNGYFDAVKEFLAQHSTKITAQQKAELENINLGDSFLSALLPQGMNTAMGVAYQLTQPNIDSMRSTLSVPVAAIKSSYQIVADICALAAKTMGGIDKRLVAVGGVVAIGGAVAYHNGAVAGIANAAGHILADAAGQSASMLMDIASAMRNQPTYV